MQNKALAQTSRIGLLEKLGFGTFSTAVIQLGILGLDLNATEEMLATISENDKQLQRRQASA